MSATGSSAARAGSIERALRPYLSRDLLRADAAQPAGAVVLAVSGGPDSTALMHAAAGIGSAQILHVATVDHGLRPDSLAEAEAVAAAARALGLRHHLLTWTGDKPAQGIQAAARVARYGLLAACAEANGAAFVLTAHTADDQAETVLMRLLAGSGAAGLSGMRSERDLGRGVRLARPFLGIAKADLVAYCEVRSLAYLRDPSNADERFARARLRRLIPDLAREGLSTARLCRLAARSARDEAALMDAAEAAFDLASHAVRPSSRRESGALTLDGPTLRALPEAVILRVVALSLDRAGGSGAFRLDRLERLVLDELLPTLEAGTQVRRTLRGILLAVAGNGDLTLRRAPERRAVKRARPCSLAAGARDLLGKGESAAYIGSECPD